MRLRLEFSYLGTKFFGYQIQPSKRTVQGELEKALSDFFNEKITLVASGRTDAGVSAIKQVAHFDIFSQNAIEIVNKDLSSIIIRLNLVLPEDIKLISLKTVEDNYHCRYNAKQKTYLYNLYFSKTEIPYLSQFCLWVKRDKVNIDAIRDCLKVLEGEHDFSSFCASNSEVEDKVRCIYNTDITKSELGYYTISITGNGFLYNMVRIIVGTMLEVGYGKLNSTDVINILKLKDRTKAGKTVSSKGLVLKEVIV